MYHNYITEPVVVLRLIVKPSIYQIPKVENFLMVKLCLYAFD